MRSIQVVAMGLLALGCTRSTTVNQDLDDTGGSASGGANTGGTSSGGTNGQGNSGGGGRGGSGGSAANGTGGSSAMGGADANGGGGGAEPPDPPSSDPGGSVPGHSLGDAEISEGTCTRNGTGATCTFTLTASMDSDLVLPMRPAVGCAEAAHAYDDRGNRYTPASVTLGSETLPNSYCALGGTLLEDLPTPAAYEFADISDDATEIALLHFVPSIAAVRGEAKLRRLSFDGPDAELGQPAADGADTLGQPLGSLNARNVRFDYYPCSMSGAEAFDCPLVITSLGADRIVRLPTHIDGFCAGEATAMDDQATSYIASRLDVGNEATTGCGFERLLVKGVPTLASYHFEGVEGDPMSVFRLQLGVLVDGVAAEVAVPEVPLER